MFVNKTIIRKHSICPFSILILKHKNLHFERKIVTKTTLSPKYLRGRGVTLAETKRKTFVTSMSSIARSRDSSIDVTPSVFIRTHS